MTPTLGSILASTRESLGPLRRRSRELEEAARRAPAPVDWVAALRHDDVSVIAEIKRRSPSAGVIADHLEAVEHAAGYVAGGARAVSVLTEPTHFGGSLADLTGVAAGVPVPVLRKDFILDEVQVLEARAAGASAVLLIVRVLDQVALRDLRQLAANLGLGCLIEVHSLGELDRALRVEPETVGVNARDLESLVVDLDAVGPVLRAVPPQVLAVAESGVERRAHVEQLAACGADAVLVGTALAGSPDPRSAVAALTGVRRHPRGH